MEIKEINVNDIVSVENSRLRTDESNVSDLMKDIKQNGLLHPIKVYQDESGKYVLLLGSRRLMAFKKLGYKQIPATIYPEIPTTEELLLMNTSENIHREDLRPYELGRIAVLLHEKGFNVKEIAARLSVSVNKVQDTMKVFTLVPLDLRDSISNVKNTRNIEGKLSTSTVREILAVRIKDKDKQRLMRYAKANALTGTDVSTFARILSSGRTFDEAVGLMSECVVKSIKIPWKKEELMDYLKDEKLTYQKYVLEVLRGQRKPVPKLLV